MSENRPEPLVPPHVDLRGMKWFALHHKNLRASRFWIHATDQVKAISIELWCEAYEQEVAASLPDDDVALSEAAGFGRRDLTEWLSVKVDVMKAWVLCSDGRWYHPKLAEVAIEAWDLTADSRRRDREKKRRKRERIKNEQSPRGQDDNPHGDEHMNPHRDNAEIPPGKTDTLSNTTQQETTGDSNPSDSVGTPATVKPAKAPAKPKAPTKKAARDARASRIEWDWTPDEIDATHAAGKGYSPEEIRAMGDGFFNHHKAKGTLMVDWRAAWRTWVSNDGKFNGGPRGGNRTSASNRRPSDDRGVTQRQDRVGAMLEGAMGALDDLRR